MNNPYYWQQSPPYGMAMGQQMQQPIQQVQPVPQQPAMQIQNGGFIVAESVEAARRWPVAPGVCVSFKIEGQQLVCTKTQGFNQFEPPVFEIYRLVKEEDPAVAQQPAEAAKNQESDRFPGSVQ